MSSQGECASRAGSGLRLPAGAPLRLFQSVFTRAPSSPTGRQSAGTPSNTGKPLRQASGGRLGCISCHDPTPCPPDQKAAHYRDRCLQCHTDGSCSLTPAARRQQNPADSCIDCHMPRAESRIAHTAVADHRVLRRPEPPRPPAPPRLLRTGEVPLRHFHRAHVNPDDPGVARDRGLALTEVGWFPHRPGRGAVALLLDAAVASAGRRRGTKRPRFLLWQLGRQRGLADLTAAGRDPRGSRRDVCGVLAAALGRDEEAIGYWRRAVAVNPWASQYHARLAKLLADRRDWTGALEECEAALRINPFHDEARALRAKCLRQSGKAVPPR